MKDLIIIGSGPAGYTAGVYARRNGLDTLLIGEKPGGTIADAHKVCNLPLFKEISGLELGKRMEESALALGVEIERDLVTEVEKNEGFLVRTKDGQAFESKHLILATGSKRRILGLEKEKEFLGKGVSYCATCDGPLFQGEKVGVVGGSNAATTAALMIADVAEKVYLIYRGERLKGEQMWIDQVFKQENIDVLFETEVSSLEGDKMLSAVRLSNGERLEVKGLFIEIGSVPNSKLYQSLGVEVDSHGYIKVDQCQMTSVDNVWAAGDVTTGSNGFRQVVTAMAEGSIAANEAYKLIKKYEST